MTTSTGTIVLAAGGATRFGSPKLLAQWWGRPLVEWALRTAPEDGPRIAVVGKETATLRPLFAHYGFAMVRNPRPSDGLASSLATGLSRMPAEVEAVLVLLGDAPDIPASVIERVRTAYRRENRAVAAAYDDVRGHPVVLPRSDWALVPQTGERAGATIDAVLVECGDLAAGSADVDTPDDLFALAARRSNAEFLDGVATLKDLDARLANPEPFVLRSVDGDKTRRVGGRSLVPVTALRDRALTRGRMISVIARVGDDYAAIVG
jgi:nicotine blue oxidoreductase